MGMTIKFSCCRCGYEKKMDLGVGMFTDIDRLFNGIVDNVRDGRYGEEWKEEIQRDPSLVVNVSDEIYICPTCGFFKTGLNLSLYKPVAESSVSSSGSEKKYGTDLTLELSRHYRLYKKYPHCCEKCGEQMNIYKMHEGKTEPTCPECGGKGRISEDVFWD